MMISKTIGIFIALAALLIFGWHLGNAHPDPEHNCIGDSAHYSCEVVAMPAPTAIPTATPAKPTEQTRLLAVLNSIPVRAEHNCYSPYTRRHYDHGVSGSQERQMAEGLGWVLPYSNARITANDLYGSRGTQIEHMVAAKEAHESGMGCRSITDRRAFGRDRSNLTLALPDVNRVKSDKDLADWLPKNNVCWFVAAIIEQKSEWKLSMDQAEWATAQQAIRGCTDFGL